eukprot:COSAG05_NODE_1977_length_3759_cov_6.284973_2_plen_231_part_00
MDRWVWVLLHLIAVGLPSFAAAFAPMTLPDEPVCLCATDAARSFEAVLTAKDDPSHAPPLLQNLNTSSYAAFHQGAGWDYLGAAPPLSTYIYAWSYPLGFPPAAPGGSAGQLGDCLAINMDNGDGTAMLRNYSLHYSPGALRCETAGRQSQAGLGEVFLYPCHCDHRMEPVVSAGGQGQCFRINGTDECGADVCDSDTYHLTWNTQHSPPCLALWNSTGTVGQPEAEVVV